MAQPRALVPAVVAALLLAACGGSSDPGPAPECLADLDCGASTTCRAHRCQAGQCVVVDAPAGTACDDGNACTLGDACQAGACAGTTPVACTALDQCHQAGTCDPATGQCSNPNVADGTACFDGDLCTLADTCQAGACTGAAPVTCLAADQCHDAGTCDPASGACTNPPAAAGVACDQGGVMCDGAGACVSCLVAADCPPAASECQLPACTSGTCGTTPAAAGTVLASQVAGDCKEAQCDATGGVVQLPLDSDLPDDGNPCTLDACSGGVPSFTALPFGTACGDGICDGAGTCLPRPTVVAISPADGSSAAGGGTVAVTFNTAMDPASLTGQVTFGACAGSLQLSLDGFASCVPFAAATPTMSGGNVVATLTPAPPLLLNRTYQVRVTTAATSGAGLSLADVVVQAVGFTVTPPASSAAQVVMSQVYGGSTTTAGSYQADFVELHNRGLTPVSLAGWSLQYASATGSTWNTFALSGTIAPGGFFLVRVGPLGSSGLPLPTPDLTWATTSMSSTSGKIALLDTATPTTTGQACPTPGATVDLVGYGTTASCSETSPAPTTSFSTSLLRRWGGCADGDDNARDLVLVAPAPRNAASPISGCGLAVVNETGLPAEADYCAAFAAAPLSLVTGAASPPLYGQVFEPGLTGGGVPPVGLRGQVGYGAVTDNPEYGGWAWFDATWLGTAGGQTDEFQGGFAAPAPGTWRYGWRFSVDDGATWTYCDADASGAGGDAGAGSSPGLTFDLQNLGVLTVTP